MTTVLNIQFKMTHGRVFGMLKIRNRIFIFCFPRTVHLQQIMCRLDTEYLMLTSMFMYFGIPRYSCVQYQSIFLTSCKNFLKFTVIFLFLFFRKEITPLFVRGVLTNRMATSNITTVILMYIWSSDLKLIFWIEKLALKYICRQPN